MNPDNSILHYDIENTLPTRIKHFRIGGWMGSLDVLSISGFPVAASAVAALITDTFQIMKELRGFVSIGKNAKNIIIIGYFTIL
jgi:hypothetical protein